MRRLVLLLKNEIKNIYRQTIVFFLIAVFMFSFSSGMLIFASDMRTAFSSYMDNNCMSPLCVYINDVKENELFQIIKQIDTLLSEPITEGVFVHQGKYVSTDNAPNGFAYPIGYGCMTNGKVPLEEQNMIMIEGDWTKLQNDKFDDGSYSIIISKTMSDMLEVHEGDNLVYYADSNLDESIANKQTLKVVGVFDDESSPNTCYYMSLSCTYALMKDESVRLLAYINRPSDSLTILPKITSMGCEVVSAGWPIEANSTVLAMEAILYVIAIIFVIATCLILGSILTVTLRMRWQYIAQLKLLGSSNNIITGLYFLWLFLVLIIAIAIGIVVSIFLCEYLSQIGGLILNYPITIQYNLETTFIVSGTSILVFIIQYFVFRWKIKKVSAIGLTKEE